MLKETSWASAVRAGPRRKPSGHGLEHLEFAAELFLDADFSLAFLKLRARLSSLLKLLTLLRLGLARCGLSSGELAGSGERQPRGEGDLDTWRLLRSRRSKGEGDLDTAGVERGESSAMSQYSSRMSGVDCLLPGQQFSSWYTLSSLSPILFWVFLGGVKEVRGGVRRSRRGGVRLSRRAPLLLRGGQPPLLVAQRGAEALLAHQVR